MTNKGKLGIGGTLVVLATTAGVLFTGGDAPEDAPPPTEDAVEVQYIDRTEKPFTEGELLALGSPGVTVLNYRYKNRQGKVVMDSTIVFDRLIKIEDGEVVIPQGARIDSVRVVRYKKKQAVPEEL